MKKLISWLLLLTLALSLCAMAEAAPAEETPADEAAELPYIASQLLNRYFGSSLTPESYDQVRLTPYTAYQLFDHDSKEPWYISFPAPENCVPSEFKMDVCQFIDDDNATQYLYAAYDNYAYETLLNKCDDESNILMDGSDGVAAYIVPEKARAFALIATKEIEKGAKLFIEIQNDNLRNADDAKKAETMRDAITAEVERVRQQMTIEKLDAHWSVGKYQGIRLTPYDAKQMTVTVPLPAFTAVDEEGNELTAPMFVVSADSNRATACVCFESGKTMTFEIEADDYSYINYKKEEDASTVSQFTLDDGSEWSVFVANRSYDESNITVAYVHQELPYKGGRDADIPMYFTLRITLNHIPCADVDTLAGFVNALVKAGYTVEAAE